MSSKSYEESMFCPLSGDLLNITEEKVYCPNCPYSKNIKEMKDLKMASSTNMEKYIQKYNLEPLVKINAFNEDDLDNEFQKAIVDEKCPKCGNPQMKFETKQMRSADEGQTVFYTCPKCSYKFSQNN